MKHLARSVVESSSCSRGDGTQLESCSAAVVRYTNAIEKGEKPKDCAMDSDTH
jgi:hypothetical protein